MLDTSYNVTSLFALRLLSLKMQDVFDAEKKSKKDFNY